MTSRPKKLLMLCYYYPPVYSGGVERSVKFARYLPEHGWTPVVITTDAYGVTEGTEQRVIRTTELLSLYRWLFNKEFRKSRRVRSSIAMIPATTPESGFRKGIVSLVLKWFLIPDIQAGWISCAFVPALRLLRGNEVDAIYTTSPPESSHLLGLLLNKLTGKPWVMDLRDPWTFEPWKEVLREPGFRLLIEQRLERLCFEHADAVVINTPETRDRYETLYPDCKSKMRVITNGFDGEELSRATAALQEPFPWRDPGEGTFVISHTGMFFRYEGLEQKVPHALLNALKALLDDRAISPGGCRVIFAGPVNEATKARIAELGLDALIETPGVISHFDAGRLMLRSDLLVLFDSSDDGRTYVRGKLYEYLASGKRILGIVPGGASRKLLKRSGHGLLVYPDDEEGICQAIVASLERREAPAKRPDFRLLHYERRRLTGKLAAILDDLFIDGSSYRR